MKWSMSQTDVDARDAQLVSEQLRHERLDHQNSIIDQIEITPPNEPIPQMTMARYRRQKLDEEVVQNKSLLQVMGDDDNIPGL